MDFEDLLERAIRALRRRARGRRVPRAVPPRSRSTSTRTSTCSSRRCSTAGSGRGTTSAWSATTTSRSTGSPVQRPSTCSRVPERFPHAAGDPAGGELPLDAAGARAGQPAGAGAGRGGEGAAARRGRTVPSPRCGRSRPGRPRVPSWSSGSARRVSARGGRDPLPHARPPGRARAGAARGEGPVPGLGAARPGGGASRSCARSIRPRRLRRASGRSPSSTAGCRSPSRGLGERELGEAGRPRRCSSGSRRRSAASGADFRAELERRFGGGADSGRGVHLLTYHGAKGLEFEVVLLPATRGEGAAAQAGAHAGRRSPRSAASSTSA